MTTEETKARPVLVTTEHRGVFFGYASEINEGERFVKLERMRNCIQWRGLKGFLDLTTTGPTASCRVGPAAKSGQLFKVTGIWDVEPAAVDAWENAPWAR